MPNRLQANVRSWVYRFLILRDGEYCLMCGKKPAKGKLLDIDHADNNPNNNDPSNLSLLCHKCNCSLRSVSSKNHVRIIAKHSAKNVSERVRDRGNGRTHEIKGKVNYEAGSPEMFANACFEEEYREWLLSQVKEYRQYPKLEAVNAGAEQVGCSPITAGRYLSKLLSESGPLELVKSPYGLSVTFKRWYQGDE